MARVKAVKMKVVSRVRVPGVGEYIRVQAPQGKEYWVKGGRYEDGMYFDPLVSINIPEGSVTEVPAIPQQVDVAVPDL